VRATCRGIKLGIIEWVKTAEGVKLPEAASKGMMSSRD
jgi:hypothetical protein